MVRPLKNTSRAVEQDWYADSDQDPLHKVQKILSMTESKDDGAALPKEIPKANLCKVFGYDRKTKQWTSMGNRCFECGKLLREGRVTEKHPLICKKTLKINKVREEEEEILKRVRKKDAS